MDIHPIVSEVYTITSWLNIEDQFSRAEYPYSLARLHSFVEEVTINNLMTLEDLSAVASLVGHDVTVLAVTQGARCEQKKPGESTAMPHIKWEYVFSRVFGRMEVEVAASEGECVLSRYYLLGFSRYRSQELSIRLPADRDIAVGQKPNVCGQCLYAKDTSAVARMYYPTREPQSPEIQQVFARLLKELLREILADLA